MPDPKAKDTARGLPHQREPSPAEVSGYFPRVNPEDLTEEEAKNWQPGQLDTSRFVPPVDPHRLDPESHVEIVPRAEREDESIPARPLNPDFRD